jgi:hypothetical protein
MLTEKLNLTDEQRTKLKPILQDQSQQQQAVHDDTSLSPEQKTAKMKSIHASFRDQISAVLTPEQQAKLKEMKHEGGEKHQQERPPSKPSSSQTQRGGPSGPPFARIGFLTGLEHFGCSGSILAVRGECNSVIAILRQSLFCFQTWRKIQRTVKPFRDCQEPRLRGGSVRLCVSFSFALSAFGLILVLSEVLNRQTAKPQSSAEPTFKTQARAVIVDVVVTDRDGRPVLQQPGSIGLCHPCFQRLRPSHPGDIHRSNRAQAAVDHKGSPLPQVRRIG